MTRSGPRPRPGDAAIIMALLAGATYSDAAAYGQCSERTVKRRMADPHFRAELQRAQDEVLGRLRRRHIASALAFQAVLRDIALDHTQPASARVRAAEVGLSRADPTPQLIALQPGPPADPQRSPREVLLESLDIVAKRLGNTDLPERLGNTGPAAGNGATHGAR